MPKKLEFNIKYSDQALLGNKQKVEIFVNKLENVNLKKLSLEFLKIEADENAETQEMFDNISLL